MRTILAVALLGSVACTDPFQVAQEADTIEAYETYLRENPDGRFASAAESRLEALMLEHAKKEGTIEAYDAYLARFPSWTHKDEAVASRETALFKHAKKENTEAGWKKFLEEYPKAEKSRKAFAEEMLEVHGYLPSLEVGKLKIEQINLAEDPEGPLDGWAFRADVKNDGKGVITNLGITIQYLNPEDRVIGERRWPLVAPYWRVPVREEAKTPIQPGQTRTWEWTTGDLPPAWDRRARIFVSNIELQD